MPSTPAREFGIGLTVASAVLWSFTPLLLRSVEEASAWQVVFYRSAFLSLALLAFLLWRHGAKAPAAFVATGRAGLIAAVGFAFGFVGYPVAIAHTTVANAAFLVTTTPVFAAVFGALFLREAVSGRSWAAIALALCGAALMVVSGLAVGEWFGNLMAALAAAGSAVFVVALRGGRDVDMVPAVCLGGILSALIGLVLAEGSIQVSAHDAMLCFVSAVAISSVGNATLAYCARAVGAAELTLLGLVESVLSPFWIWLFHGETPSTLTLVGGTLVLAAVAWQALGGRVREPAAVFT